MKDPHGAIIHVAALSEECPEMEADQLTQICHKTSKVPMDACCPDQDHQGWSFALKYMRGCQKSKGSVQAQCLEQASRSCCQFVVAKRNNYSRWFSSSGWMGTVDAICKQ